MSHFYPETCRDIQHPRARPEPKAETKARLLDRDSEGYRWHSMINNSQPTWYMSRTMLSSTWQPGHHVVHSGCGALKEMGNSNRMWKVMCF